MPIRSRLALAFICLAAWPLSIHSLPLGVLKAKASVDPERIPQGGKTEITVVTEDGFHKPISEASVKITIDSGYFEASGQTTVLGYTDKDGIFKAVWFSNLKTEDGIQTFNISASKNGYASQYPVTASANLIVGDKPEDLLRLEKKNKGF